MGSVRLDVKGGLRSLTATPVPTAVAIGTVAVAIALTTLTLSTIRATLLRPPPFAHAERVMAIGWIDADFEARDLNYFRERQTAFEQVEGYFRSRVSVQAVGRYPESVRAAFVTAGALSHLGVTPYLGQLFPAGEGLTEPVQHVLLGYDLWRAGYGGDADVLGRTIEVDGRPLQVIGVMPAGFGFPVTESMWIPFDVGYGGGPASDRSFFAFGRLEPHRTIQDATVEATRIADAIRADLSPENPPEGATIRPFARRHLPTGIDSLLFVMLAAVAGVLLVACSNLANLLLARMSTRRREIAVRGALGATAGRILQQFFLEALILASVGAIIGFGLALVGMRALTSSVADVTLPYWIDFQADGTVMVATVGLMVAVALVTGGLPALRAVRTNAQPLLRDGGRGSSQARIGRVGSALVTAQITLSLALLLGAGLLIKSVTRLQSLDRGFEAEGILVAGITLTPTLHPDPNRTFQTLLREFEALSGVSEATIARNAPGTGTTFAWNVWVQGVEYDRTGPSADGKNVGHGYFRTMGLDLVEGRTFTSEESLFNETSDGPRVVVVNRTFADRRLESRPIGKRVQFGSHDPDGPWFTVVGVVEDGYVGSSSGGIGLRSAPREQVYIPWGLAPYRSGVLLLRTAGDPESAIPAVRDLMARLVPEAPLVDPAPLVRRIEETTWAFGLFGKVFSTFGVSALFMAMAGLYGVIAFDMAQRRREMGTRMALGAAPAAIVRLAMRDGIVQLGLGLLLGSSIGLLLARALRALIFDVSTRDAQVFLSVVAVVSLASLLAALFPALGMAGLKPAHALRRE